MNSIHLKINQILDDLESGSPLKSEEVLTFCAESEHYLNQGPATDESDHGLLAKIGFIKGKFSFVSGDHDLAISNYEKCLKLFQQAEDIRYQALILKDLALCYEYSAMQSVSTKYLFEALDLATKLNDKKLLAQIHYAFGIAYGVQKSYELAVESSRKSMVFAIESGSVKLENDARSSVGNLLGYLNRSDEGIDWVLAALKKAKISIYSDQLCMLIFI